VDDINLTEGYIQITFWIYHYSSWTDRVIWSSYANIVNYMTNMILEHDIKYTKPKLYIELNNYDTDMGSCV